MTNRRQFFTCGTVATLSAAFCSKAQAKSFQSTSTVSKVGGYNYRLPKFKTGSRLLFQGDSITDMNWGRNQKDRNHYLGHSYVYLIASRLGVDMPEAQLDVYNRGISGNIVADLRKRWQKDAIDMKPDLLSILIGTNDLGRGIKAEPFESDYRYILDASRKDRPDLRLVLLDPFILKTGSFENEQTWKKRRLGIDSFGSIIERLAKEYQAVHIRTQELFDEAARATSDAQWMWDGIHPLPQGHELIARTWIEAVSERWPQD